MAYFLAAVKWVKVGGIPSEHSKGWSLHRDTWGLKENQAYIILQIVNIRTRVDNSKELFLNKINLSPFLPEQTCLVPYASP